MQVSFGLCLIFTILQFAGPGTPLSYLGNNHGDKTGITTDTNQRKLIQWRDRLYTDTSWSSTFSADSIFVYYYNVRSKYPESSESISNHATQFLEERNIKNTGSGYITFRFFIDSTGQIQKRVQVIETNEYYKDYRFDENLVWTLFDYLKTLKEWKPSKAPKGFPPFYIAIMTFKIHEGKIVAVIP